MPGAVGVHVPNHLMGAILSAVFCCQIGGVIAIVYACKVNTKLAQGDVAGAQDASNTARTWIVLNVLAVAIPVLFVLFLALIGAFSQSAR